MTVKLEPTPTPLPKPQRKPEPSPAEKSAAKKAITAHKRNTAWSLNRWPLEKKIVEEKVKVYLPRSYLSTHGADVKVVWEGMDLNQFVYRHYYEVCGGKLEEGMAGSNFVDSAKVQPRRHEYLGPDPRVAGYIRDEDGEIQIQWWDGYLQDQWMGKTRWNVEIETDGEGNIVEKDTF